MESNNASCEVDVSQMPENNSLKNDLLVLSQKCHLKVYPSIPLHELLRKLNIYKKIYLRVVAVDPFKNNLAYTRD